MAVGCNENEAQTVKLIPTAELKADAKHFIRVLIPIPNTY
jgi:hypothetical protein